MDDDLKGRLIVQLRHIDTDSLLSALTEYILLDLQDRNIKFNDDTRDTTSFVVPDLP